MITQIARIQTVAHDVETAGGPAGLGLALTVAAALHPPVTRAPEVATAPATARRNTAARPHRRTVRG
ncbi:hypothetical protein [Streptomyces sp. DSM 40750]|uniref:hypothetical protein n=1 Tax=Streptomyces sp. DSM 40750 TaxID=2801030 RepID=UPI00214B8062|nr:hypothetical protein [Streptomyces sp. DSM 40750]UUU23178.1 hypothetical protein JIX55_24405 [Streptomyces sp. DSM 40750]